MYSEPIEIPLGSVEVLRARARTSDSTLLSAAVVELSVAPLPATGSPVVYSWQAAVWDDATPSPNRAAHTVAAVSWSTAGAKVVHMRFDGAQILACGNTVTVR